MSSFLSTLSTLLKPPPSQPQRPAISNPTPQQTNRNLFMDSMDSRKGSTGDRDRDNNGGSGRMKGIRGSVVPFKGFTAPTPTTTTFTSSNRNQTIPKSKPNNNNRNLTPSPPHTNNSTPDSTPRSKSKQKQRPSLPPIDIVAAESPAGRGKSGRDREKIIIEQGPTPGGGVVGYGSGYEYSPSPSATIDDSGNGMRLRRRSGSNSAGSGSSTTIERNGNPISKDKRRTLGELSLIEGYRHRTPVPFGDVSGWVVGGGDSGGDRDRDSDDGSFRTATSGSNTDTDRGLIVPDGLDDRGLPLPPHQHQQQNHPLLIHSNSSSSIPLGMGPSKIPSDGYPTPNIPVSAISTGIITGGGSGSEIGFGGGSGGGRTYTAATGEFGEIGKSPGIIQSMERNFSRPYPSLGSAGVRRDGHQGRQQCQYQVGPRTITGVGAGSNSNPNSYLDSHGSGGESVSNTARQRSLEAGNTMTSNSNSTSNLTINNINIIHGRTPPPVLAPNKSTPNSSNGSSKGKIKHPIPVSEPSPFLETKPSKSNYQQGPEPGAGIQKSTLGSLTSKFRRKEVGNQAKPQVDKSRKKDLDEELDRELGFVTIEPGHNYAPWNRGAVASAMPEGGNTEVDEGPRTGHVLHNILLTPTPFTTNTGNGKKINPGIASGPGQSQSKRETMMGKASRMLTERRLAWLHAREALDGNRDGSGNRNDGYQGMMDMQTFKTGGNGRSDTPTGGARIRKGAPWATTGNGETDERSPLRSDGGSRRWMLSTPDVEAHYGSQREKARRFFERNEQERSKQRKKWILIVAISALVLASIIIGVCVSLLTRGSSSNTSTSTSSSDGNSIITTSSPTKPSKSPTPTSTAYTLDSCLSLFALSAPTSPTSYPCDSCLPLLRSSTNDFMTGGDNSTGVGSAIQFCGLQAIYTSAGTVAKQNGTNTASGLGGWMNGVNVCTGWTGVGCDQLGRVTGLTLTYPNVPATISDTLAGLVSLKSLKIVGNSNVPSGSIPSTIFNSLTNLTSLDVQSTALSGPLPSFNSLTGLLRISLVSNSKLGSGLPDLKSCGGLLTLSVTGQSLTTITGLPNSITYLDLSYNSLSGALPSLDQFSSLNSLFLDSNQLTSLPSSFPSSLQTLSLINNPSLSGTLPLTLCSSSNLSTCNLWGTSLSQSNTINTTMTNVVTRTTTIAVGGGGSTVATSSSTSFAVSQGTQGVCGGCRFT